MSHHLYAIATILCWSLAYVYTRLSLEYFSIYSLGFLRYLIASAMLLAVVAIKRIRPPARGDWGKVIASGAAGFFLYMLAFNTGSRMETSATGSVIIATAPVITALLSLVLFGEHLSLLQWGAAAVEFIGVALLTLANGSFSLGAGIPWLLAAALLLGFFNLLQRRLTRVYTGLQASIYSIFAGTLMLAVFAPESASQLVFCPPKYLGYLILLGVFPSAIAYVSWSIALERAPSAASVSNYMFLTPFFAALLGFLVAGERPGSGALLGGAVILSGVFLFNISGRARQKTG